MTVVQCLLLAVGSESCIRCGLIQSNTGYRALFEASTIRAEITDEARQTVYAFTQICAATGNVDFICAGEAVPRHNRDKYPDWRFQYATLQNVPQRCVIPVSVPEALQT